MHRSDRSTDTISVTPICDFWPGLAGYDEYNGYAAGMWRGPSYIDGFTADLTDPGHEESEHGQRDAVRGAHGRQGRLRPGGRWCSWVPTRATATRAGESMIERGRGRTGRALTAIVRERLADDDATVVEVNRTERGFSTETYLFTVKDGSGRPRIWYCDGRPRSRCSPTTTCAGSTW